MSGQTSALLAACGTAMDGYRAAELAGTPHEVYPFKIACTEAVMLPGLPPQTSKNGDTSPGKKT